MNYVTTNIRIPEEDYLRLKNEAAKKRTSLSSVIRAKIKADHPKRTPEEVAAFMNDLDDLAKKTAKKLKGWNSLKALREIRSEGK